MQSVLTRYTRWLHTGWPAGEVEKLPVVQSDGSTNVPGLYVVGDLTGIPLLKFAVDSGARAIGTITTDPQFARQRAGRGQGGAHVHELVIVGGGVAGMSAALEARREGLDFVLLEATEPFSTIVNFPAGKPIYTYPTSMQTAGTMELRAEVKEELVRELRAQTVEQGIIPRLGRCTRIARRGDFLEVEVEGQAALRALRVIVAIGRSGEYRRLDAPGADRGKVLNRLHDPKEYRGRRVLVVGGGDSALETANALAASGATVTLSYRRAEFNRPKSENVERMRELRASAAHQLEVLMESSVTRIDDDLVYLRTASGERVLENDWVFTMLGREAPLDFVRRSGVKIHGEWTRTTKLSFAAILLAAVFVYHWKSSAATAIPLYAWFEQARWFPFNLGSPSDPSTLVGTLALSLKSPSFYYSLAYSLAVTVFGIARIRRRRTPYITVQTVTLTLIQVIPLFLLPYLLLPWLGHNGAFDAGWGRSVADALFPLTEWDAHGREYWRSIGLVLAWPLMFWNVFTDQPLGAWLAIGFVQTFVLIPLMIYFWGKGAYCGWICSCGALAETVGDTLRQKMPHGAKWNRLNMVGQVILALAFVLLVLRTVSWALPDTSLGQGMKAAYMALFLGRTAEWSVLPFPLTFLNYNWIVDVTLAGIVGIGFYMHFSGRVWCRFACPLAALMHVYARFSRFRILADKKKCISCNVCTTVCHQGIDVMSFANKGEPMADVQCVRCSACVQSCPTGVLEFGQIDPKTERVLTRDRLGASPVRMREER
jgi:NosR/NirI family transcriptional regulator, nitrous oxide reductase regulator